MCFRPVLHPKTVILTSNRPRLPKFAKTGENIKDAHRKTVALGPSESPRSIFSTHLSSLYPDPLYSTFPVWWWLLTYHGWWVLTYGWWILNYEWWIIIIIHHHSSSFIIIHHHHSSSSFIIIHHHSSSFIFNPYSIQCVRKNGGWETALCMGYEPMLEKNCLFSFFLDTRFFLTWVRDPIAFRFA